MEVPLFDDLYSFDEYSKNRVLSKKEKLTSKQASSDVMDSRLKMLAGAGGGGSGTDLGSSKWTAIENHMLSHGLSTDALEPDAEEMVMNEELKKKRRSSGGGSKRAETSSSHDESSDDDSAEDVC